MTMFQAILMMIFLAVAAIGAMVGLTLIGLGAGDQAGSNLEPSAAAWFDLARNALRA